MQIQSIQNSGYSPNFGIKLDTSNVLEVTSRKMINGNGVNGMKDVFLKLHPSKENRVGCRGYFGYAKEIGQKIMEKYPEIKKATDSITEIYNKYQNNPQKLKRECKNIIDKIGNEVDITL